MKTGVQSVTIKLKGPEVADSLREAFANPGLFYGIDIRESGEEFCIGRHTFEIVDHEGTGEIGAVTRIVLSVDMSETSVDMIVALDSSYSMITEYENTTRFDLAVEGILSLLSNRSRELVAGLMAYGVEWEMSLDLTEANTFTPTELNSLRKELAGIRHKGKAAAGTALNGVSEVFSIKGSGDLRVVVLITDGADEVGPNPLTEADKLVARGTYIYPFYLGEETDEKSLIILKRIAGKSHTKFFSLHDAMEEEKRRLIRASLRSELLEDWDACSPSDTEVLDAETVDHETSGSRVGYAGSTDPLTCGSDDPGRNAVDGMPSEPRGEDPATTGNGTRGSSCGAADTDRDDKDVLDTVALEASSDGRGKRDMDAGSLSDDAPVGTSNGGDPSRDRNRVLSPKGFDKGSDRASEGNPDGSSHRVSDGGGPDSNPDEGSKNRSHNGWKDGSHDGSKDGSHDGSKGSHDGSKDGSHDSEGSDEGTVQRSGRGSGTVSAGSRGSPTAMKVAPTTSKTDTGTGDPEMASPDLGPEDVPKTATAHEGPAIPTGSELLIRELGDLGKNLTFLLQEGGCTIVQDEDDDVQVIKAGIPTDIQETNDRSNEPTFRKTPKIIDVIKNIIEWIKNLIW